LLLGCQFLKSKSRQAVHALETKQTFLSDSEWKSIPFATDKKTRYDRILDLLLEAPALLRRGEYLDKIKSDGERYPVALEIFEDCLEFDRRMQSIIAELESEKKTSPFWTSPDPTGSASTRDQHMITTKEGSNKPLIEYEFDNMVTAINMILLWAMQTLLWSSMTKLYILITTVQLTRGISPTIPGWEKRFTHFVIPARNVLQSAAYFMKNEPSARIAVAPLMMVLDSLHSWADGKDFEIELTYGKMMLARIEKKGMRLIKHLGPYSKCQGQVGGQAVNV
jgi:hypothetical protein